MPKENPKNKWEQKWERVSNSDTLGMLCRKLRGGYSPTVLVVGPTRSGKSLTAVWLAQQVAKKMGWDFSLEESYYYGIIGFLDDVKKLKARVVVIDEIGVDLSAHEWFSIWNMTFNQIMQTQAIKNNLYILVVPYARYVAKAHLPLIDVIGEKINRTRISMYKMTPAYADFRPSKFLWRFYIETLKDIPLPPPNIMRAFKKQEIENKRILEDRILAKLKTIRDKKAQDDAPPVPQLVKKTENDPEI